MAGKAKRELSTKWWNVIRRQINATQARVFNVPCPDCGSGMFLAQGRYGRFYRCSIPDCRGTWGARLDGTPRKPRGPADLLQARERARDAVHRLLVERQFVNARLVEEKRAAGLSWWNTPTGILACKDDLHSIWLDAKLPPVPVPMKKRRRSVGLRATAFWPSGLFLRRRTIEECQRVEAAANILLRRIRKHAWDRVLLDDDADDADDQNKSLSPASLSQALRTPGNFF